MDFVTGLPVTPRSVDAVLVVVDLFTKMTHFIPTRKTATAKDTADLFFHQVFRYHGLPQKIVSDRDPKFISHFWKALFKACGTQLALSSSYHPQTDGQTERMNRTMEDALRSFVAPDQTDWDQHLTALEVAYNSAVQESTGRTPFELNYGREPLLPRDLTGVQLQTPAAHSYLEQLTSNLQTARENLAKAKERQASLANAHRRELQLKEGDLVRLNTSNLNFAGNLSRKLLPKFTRPLKVVEVISPVAYRLELPSAWRIHDVFHVSLLKPFKDPNSVFPGRSVPAPEPELVDGELEYEVQQVLAHRDTRSGRQFLLRWKGYGPEEDTWETEQNIHAPLLLRQYWRRQQA